MNTQKNRDNHIEQLGSETTFENLQQILKDMQLVQTAEKIVTYLSSLLEP